jgi:hypothetical protein
MPKKIKDLAVATGTYRNSYNEEKRRYMNCGALMEGDEGGMFIMLNKYIDYGKIPSQGDSLLISVFDLKDRDQLGGNNAAGHQNQNGMGTRDDISRVQTRDDLDDDVPF